VWLAEKLASIGWITPGQLEEAVLMVSELVTNVLEHTSSAPSLSVSHRPGSVRVAVQDSCGGWPAIPRKEPSRPRGNGLRIVNAWASRWGADPVPAGGKTVWFTIER